MPVNFLNFSESTTTVDTDYIVGFANSNKGGERRWSVSALAAKFASPAQSIARAWVNFDGTFATSPFTVGSGIRKAYNVSSVTRLAAGDYQINFTTPMSDSNYAVVTGCFNAGANNAYSTTANIDYTTMTTSSCVIKIFFYTSNNENVEYIAAAFFN